MLKQCLVNVDFSRLHVNPQLRPKCGEIFYESENEFCSFQLVCCLCEMKHFAFDDFSMHIRNVHFDKQGKPRTQVKADRNDACQQLPPLNVTANAGDDERNEGSDEDDNDGDTLRVCSFDEVKLETVQLENNKNGRAEDSCHSADELDAPTAGVPSFTDVDDDEEATDSEAEPQSVFKKQPDPKEYPCKYCRGKYTTQKYLNMHVKVRHPHPNGFKCTDCDATFDVQRAMLSHRRKEHTEFPCNVCGKVYKSSRTLLRHVQAHSGLRQFKCEHESCGKSFVSQHNLTSHRRVHSTERNYVCELCGYRSRYRDALIVHRRTHTGEKPFKCQTCARCFASKSLLNEHQAMHSTERPYKCDHCEAAFSRPKALYHHKHLHLGVKKFKCKICGNAYAQAAGLSAHMRGHKAQAINGIVDSGSAIACPPHL
ncbi:zinc finger protein 2 homolog [Drosophila mojavensis]|uniref:C2H2-type domain-containing protein n=1 Tax=Drosophila mojavensis TaxID=7230 RepID=B4L8H0_DROMO|nr:zinc finger protein 2 homolog [Drosophila mojavensis]EDW07945.1 uncharacterized protein Dmoj_GI14368 [Drosophila mojavensis]